jgi:hypothetical protein
LRWKPEIILKRPGFRLGRADQSVRAAQPASVAVKVGKRVWSAGEAVATRVVGEGADAGVIGSELAQARPRPGVVGVSVGTGCDAEVPRVCSGEREEHAASAMKLTERSQPPLREYRIRVARSERSRM